MTNADFDANTALVEKKLREFVEAARLLPGFFVSAFFICPKPDGADARLMAEVDCSNDPYYATRGATKAIEILDASIDHFARLRHWAEYLKTEPEGLRKKPEPEAVWNRQGEPFRRGG